MNQTPTLVLINFTYPILAAAPTAFFFLSIQDLVHISLLVHHKHGAMQIYFAKKPFHDSGIQTFSQGNRIKKLRSKCDVWPLFDVSSQSSFCIL